MPRDVLGLDPYQRSAISCARVGCALATVSVLTSAGLLIYAFLVPSPHSLPMLSAGFAILSIVLLIVVRLRLNKESLGWNDIC